MTTWNEYQKMVSQTFCKQADAKEWRRAVAAARRHDATGMGDAAGTATPE